MSDKRTMNPYDIFNTCSQQWEKQANDLIHLWTNNQEFVRFTGIGIDTHAQSLEIFNKNQELVVNQLRLPTKTDMANLAKLSIQTEEKLDSLEEQIWHLQESVDSSNEEIAGIVEVSHDIIKFSKQLKADLSKTQKDLAVANDLISELKEVKNELGEINNLKNEITILRELLVEDLAPRAETTKTSE